MVLIGFFYGLQSFSRARCACVLFVVLVTFPTKIVRASMSVINNWLSHVTPMSSDDRPGVTSPLRSSRCIREFQAV